VEDSGPGLSTKDAERVFERFYRADKSRSRASGGVGLGLSIVAAVAEAHGGSVATVARDGAGATFRMTLPAVHVAGHSHRVHARSGRDRVGESRSGLPRPSASR
jgi:two-component system, OmpR family, sensor kinase